MSIEQAMPNSRDIVITPRQLRGARHALGWSRQRLAGASNTTANFIKVYEEEGRIARINLRQLVFNGLEAVRTTLAECGVEFVNDADVRLRDAPRPVPFRASRPVSREIVSDLNLAALQHCPTPRDGS